MTWVWVGIVVNALINLRVAVLNVQDGDDRVKAGVVSAEDVLTWDSGGIFYIIVCVVLSPVWTAAWTLKRILFPFGVKSKFARQREREKALKAAKKVEKEQERRLNAQLREVLQWVPGSIVLNEPERPTLAWDNAANAFDAASVKVYQDRGLPWQAHAGSVQ